MASALRRFALSSSQQLRKFSTSVVRRSHAQEEGIVGYNLPFDIHKRWKLATVMTLYFTSGLSAPYIVIRYNLLKAADA